MGGGGSLIQRVKHGSFTEESQLRETNQKIQFKILNKLMSTKGKSSLPVYTVAVERVELLNQFFINIIEQLCHDLGEDTGSHHIDVPTPYAHTEPLIHKCRFLLGFMNF